MAIEYVKCRMCHGTGKLPALHSVEEHPKRTCSCEKCGNVHVDPAYKVGDPCRSCGGDGREVTYNFGRQ